MSHFVTNDLRFDEVGFLEIKASNSDVKSSVVNSPAKTDDDLLTREELSE